ncbi:MAG: PadR family transcriptional regulator [Chloroflexi bacterium]|nr:PadR family transcriptional regulator [Chloroflexota bacterium]
MPAQEQPQSLPTTSYAVLGLLSFRAMSGYDLKQFADRSIGHFYWSPAKSQIYSELRRLKQAGLVSDRHVEQEARPDKRIYEITEAGRKQLANWVGNSELEPAVFKSTFLLRVFLGRSAGPDALSRLLKQHLAHEEVMLTHLREAEAECSPYSDESLYSLLTIRAGIHITEASIKWSHESMEAISKLHSGSPRHLNSGESVSS